VILRASKSAARFLAGKISLAMSTPVPVSESSTAAAPGPTCRSTLSLPPSVVLFRSWIKKATPGERLTYYRGFLARDRVQGTTSLEEAERRKLSALADHASALAGQGKLHLLQERHGNSDYSYWAITRAPSGSVVARTRLPATADKFAIADVVDCEAGAPHRPELWMAAHLLEREEVAQ
jgi:hypothetical protein